MKKTMEMELGNGLTLGQSLDVIRDNEIVNMLIGIIESQAEVIDGLDGKVKELKGQAYILGL